MLHRKQIVASRHPGSATVDHFFWLPWMDECAENLVQRFSGEKTLVRSKIPGERVVETAGNVPRNLIERFHFTLETGFVPGVKEYRVTLLQFQLHSPGRAPEGIVRLAGKCGWGVSFLIASNTKTVGDPGLKPTI